MNLFACELSNTEDPERIVKKIITEREPVRRDGLTGKWLLLHQEDGVNWGRIDDQGITYSHDFFPMYSPEPQISKLLTVRIFEQIGEIMIWSVGNEFAGRILSDAGNNTPEWGKALDQSIVLLGDRLMKKPDGGFSVIENASGSRQAIPLVCSEADFVDRISSLRLNVRHYFEQTPETGVVRIAASRLVDLVKEDK